MKRVALIGLLLLAGWGALLTVLLATETWSSEIWPPAGSHAHHGKKHGGHDHDSDHDRDHSGSAGASASTPAPVPSAAPAPAGPTPGGTAPNTIVASRHAVCAREESPPALSRVRLSDKGRELWALHCGSSAHVLSIEDAAGALLVRRVLSAQIGSHNAGEAPRAVRISAGDIDGDGREDLLVPVLFTDRAGAPASGALNWLRQRAQGGFEIPGRALDVAVGDATFATLDAQKAEDMAVIQLADARAARGSELWLLHGGPSPLRYARLAAGVGPSSVAATDLDRDGLDDIAVVSEREGRLRLWMSSQGGAAPGEPVVIELEGVREAFAGDVDGDGARDLVLTGARVWILTARNDFRPEPTPIPNSEGLRDVHLEDANADGRLDLIGYAHPELVALEQRGPATFERRTLATLHGDLGVLFARAAQLDADGHPDVVLVVVGDRPDAQLEIAVAPNVHEGSIVELAEQSEAVRDTPLLERFALP